MKPIVMLWAAAIAIVGSCLFWRNRRRYRRKAFLWVAMKSAVELLILFLVAALMPALLIVWLVVWVTRPIKTPWVRTIVGVLSGVVFGIFSSFALEALIFFGIFAIDLKTGATTAASCIAGSVPARKMLIATQPCWCLKRRPHRSFPLFSLQPIHPTVDTA